MLAAPMDDVTNLHCLIEIPKGSRNKYEWDPDLQAIKLNRFLFSSVHYPTDYGFITETIGPHGDALDALVCVSAATFPGCLIEVRPVGVLRMTDEEGQSDKLVCVPTDDPDWEKVEELDDMSSQLRTEIQHFYSMYKEPEGKHVDVQGWDDAAAAAEAIQKGRKAYQERNS
jgi:inorganic pyrophosphatase